MVQSYDGIHESPDCPPQDVIDDDDCLDGCSFSKVEKGKLSKLKQKTCLEMRKSKILTTYSS